MIKHINTELLPKEDLIKELLSLKSSYDELTLKNYWDFVYDKYAECLYKINTNVCVAYRLKGSSVWVEEPNTNLIYVESHIVPKDVIISYVSNIKGVHVATTIVNKWYQDYSAFFFDASIGETLFYLSRFKGSWEADNNVLRYR